jgi:hypothetical protein
VRRLRSTDSFGHARAAPFGVTSATPCISATPYDKLYEHYDDGTWSKQKFADCHILFFEGTSDYDYARFLFG